MNNIEHTAGSHYRAPVEASYTPPPARIARPDEGFIGRNVTATDIGIADTAAPASAAPMAAQKTSAVRPQNQPKQGSRPQRIRQMLETNANWYSSADIAAALGDIDQKQANTAVSNLIESMPGLVTTHRAIGHVNRYSWAAHNLPAPALTDATIRTTTPLAKRSTTPAPAAAAEPTPAPEAPDDYTAIERRVLDAMADSAIYHTKYSIAAALDITHNLAHGTLQNLCRTSDDVIRCHDGDVPRYYHKKHQSVLAWTAAPPPATTEYREDIMQQAVIELLQTNCAWHSAATVAATLEITTDEADEILQHLHRTHHDVMKKCAALTAIYCHRSHIDSLCALMLAHQKNSDTAGIPATLHSIVGTQEPIIDAINASLNELEHALHHRPHIPTTIIELWATTLERLAELLDPTIGCVLDDIRQHLEATA